MNAGEEEKSDLTQLQDDILQLISKKLPTNVKIQVKTQSTTKNFDAHAVILSTRSPIFADAFNQNQQGSSFEIEGVSIRGFEILLGYIYNNTLSSDCPNELIEVSKAARRLKVDGVVRACKYKLEKCLVDINNVCDMFAASRYFKMEGVSTKCLKIIQTIPENELVQNPQFLSASKETVSAILELKNLSIQTSIVAAIEWLQYHKIRDRNMLSKFNIPSLSSEGFLNLLKKFPSFFTSREVACLLSNILCPGIMELPPWCESDTNKPMIDNEEFLPSAYEEIIESTEQVKTDCNKYFPKSHIYGRDGFEGSIIFEVKLSNSFPNESHLVMLELAFGTSYVPLENLELDLFRYELSSSLKTEILFVLKSTPEHYYLIFKRKIRLPPNHPFVFCLNLRAFGLRRWGEDSPVSNGQYRAVHIPGDIFHSMGLKAFGHKSVCLTMLSDWLVFLDPTRGDKRLLLTSFYFDSTL